MTLAVSSLVTRCSVEQQVVGVNIDFDSPSNRWHCEIERYPSTAGKQ